MSRILLTEDSPTQAAAYSVLLQESGFEVLEATSAEQALQILEENRVDLLLTDLTLPGLSGIELCRKVRSHPRTEALPVVVLTGSCDVANVLRSLEAGATAYSSKGRPPEQLLSTIQQALQIPDTPESTLKETIQFRGQSFELEVAPSRLLGVMLSAFEDLSALNEGHEQLNRQLETELKQRAAAERALRDSEAIYHSLVENVPVSLFRKNVEGQFTFGNLPFCRELGIAPEELAGKTDFDFFPPELAEKYRANDLEVMRSGEVFEDVEAHRTPNGQQLFVQVLKAPVLDADGVISGIQCVFWDVTDRELAQRQLKDSEARKQAIFEGSLDCMIISDEQGHIVEFNRAAERIFGYSRDEMLGRALDSLFMTSDRARENLDRYSSQGEEGSMIGKRQETPLRRSDGSMFMAEVAMQPIPLGDTVQFATVLHDITRRKQWEQELKEARDAAEAANIAKSDFLANMSHEIRTPMNAVIGMTELVLGTELTADQRQHLQIVQDSADSLLELINDILDFSKIEAGKLDLDPQPFAVRERIGDTMKSLAVRAHEKELELACHISPDVPDAVTGDAGRLRQVIVNLTGNAIKFTDRGEVVLDVSLVSAEEKEIVLRFEVRDTGIGISRHHQRVIFRAFEQADTSTTRRFGGTGLGLAISSRLVQLMGGTIGVESETGKGSTFYFTARFQKADAELVPDTITHPRSVQDVSALVVDDNDTNRRILDEMLQAWGMKSHSVTSGREALQALAERQSANRSFGLLITDVNMPEMDGFQLVQSVRDDPELGDMRVVMLSSADRPGDLELCRQLNVDRYMTKPVKQSELLHAIESVAGVETALESSPVGPSLEDTIEPLKILLAEDSPTNQVLALALLEMQGHSVQVANNGVEAVERSAKEPFDVILMDVQMPELDGLAATRQIRQREKSGGTRIPIIAMTAHAMKGDRDRCLEVGMDDYVSKPICTGEFYAALARVKSHTSSDPSASPEICHPPEPAATATDTAAISVELPDEDAPMLDWDAALKTVNGHQSILEGVLEAVLEECPQLLEQLDSALSQEDAQTVQRAAHTIKGSMRAFNAVEITDVAQRIEDAGRDGALENVRALAEQLQTLLMQAMKEIREFLNPDSAETTSESIFDD